MVRVIFGGQVLSVSESVCTEQGYTEFRTPLCVILAMPLVLTAKMWVNYHILWENF